MKAFMGDGYTQSVTYQMKDYGVGRLYPYPYNSYQNTYNILRRVFIDGNLISVDIVNAHPTFMTQLCERYSKFTPEILNTYVDNRDVVRKLIMKECGISKAQAKNLVLVMMFGGYYRKWFKDNNVPFSGCEFLKTFHEELRTISTKVAKKNFPGYAKFQKIAKEKRADDDNNAEERTAIALYLQDTERQVIMCLIEYAQQKGIEVSSIIHDEILITKKVQIDLAEAQQYIYDKTGFSIKLESKNTAPSEEDWDWVKLHDPFIRKEKVEPNPEITQTSTKRKADYDRQFLNKRLAGYRFQDKLKNRKTDMDITFLEKLIKEKENVCWMCAKKLDNKDFTVDRINDDYGHLKSNVDIACLRCNISRSNLKI
jgi:hypothetical protein